MTNPNHAEVRKSFGLPGDEEAIAIMEGRLPASDLPETHDQAAALARGLLDEKVGVEEPRHGNVLELITRQPWMRMAAALVLGVSVSTLVTTRMQVAEEPGSSVASANVVVLEVYRSVETEIPVVRVAEDEPWVSLVAYPDFDDADRIRVYVERAAGDAQLPQRWLPILEETVGVGTQDSIMVSIPSNALGSGFHRLRIESESNGTAVGTTSLQFQVLK